MAVDTKKLARSRPGATMEVSDNEVTPAGLWRHPDTGEEVATKYDPLYGDVQSQAFARLGFEHVGDVPEGYIKEIGDLNAAHEANPNTKVQELIDVVKGQNARINQLESEKARLESPAPEEADELQAGKVKDEAANQVAARGQGNAPVEGGEVVKSLDKQNSAELKATAEAEGVDVTGLDTNKKLKEAIQGRRDEVAADGSEEGKQ